MPSRLLSDNSHPLSPFGHPGVWPCSRSRRRLPQMMTVRLDARLELKSSTSAANLGPPLIPRLHGRDQAQSRVSDGNNQAQPGVQSGVFVTSRWFPLMLALLQTVRHVSCLAYDYLDYEERSKVIDFVKRDLARPLFQPSGFCGAWVSYSSGQTANLGLDMPAYAAGGLLHSAVNRSPACDLTLTTPRGQIIAAAFVFPVWWFAGLSIRRLAQRRWRRHASRRWRLPLWCCLLVAPLGFLMLAFSVAGVFVGTIGSALRALGLAFWLLAFATLAAERLRVWRFNGADEHQF